MLRTVLEVAGGIVVIVLGILFISYLPMNPLNLATDLIFVGVGVLLIRGAYFNRKKANTQTHLANKGSKKQNSKQGTRKKT